MTAQELGDRLTARFGERIVAVVTDAVDPWIEIKPKSLVDICTYLRDESDLRFDLLNCITVIDYLETDPKKAAKIDWEPHLMMVYHLSSIANNTTCVLKARLPRWKDDVEGQLPEMPTLNGVWRTADWHEREVFDLSGIRFLGHPDMRRILCPEDWVGYPLRKDYIMPEEYHGIKNK